MPEKQPPFRTLQHPNYESIEELAGKLRRILKRAGAYNPDLLYTGVYDIPLETLTQHGADRPDRKSTFALGEEGFAEEFTPLGYARRGKNPKLDPVILVYDPTLFDHSEQEPEVYNLRPGTTMRQALIAAFKIQEV